MRKYILIFCIAVPILLLIWNMADPAKESKITHNGTVEKSKSDQDGIMPEDKVIEAVANGIIKGEGVDAAVSDQTQKPEETVDNTQTNAEIFYQVAEEDYGLSPEEAQSWFDIVTEDDIFDGGVREISDLLFDDIDGNGKTDMVIMVQETEMKYCYGTGALYFYMNEEEPYCFTDEDFPFFRPANICYADLNGDGNVEIAFALTGTGNGGSGDWHKAIFSYTKDTMERLEFPVDEDSDYPDDDEFTVNVIIEPEPDTYTAYCPYFDEAITFQASNMYRGDDQKTFLADAPKVEGGNIRGFYDLQIVAWEGRNALQVREYLCGEGGNVHCVGWAYFIFVWDEQNNSSVADWWVEGVLDE